MSTHVRSSIYNRILRVLLFRNNVKVYSGLILLYMHFDIHKLVRIDCGSAFHNFEAEYE